MRRFTPARFFRASAVALAMACLVSPRLGLAQEKKKTELHAQMEEMDKAFKQLKRTIRSAQQDKQSLELLGKIEQLAVSCKAMGPQKAAAIPADKREQFLAAYRKEMAHLISDFCAMETALIDGDRAKAQSLYKALDKDKEDGHDKFLDDEEAKPDKAK